MHYRTLLTFKTSLFGLFPDTTSRYSLSIYSHTVDPLIRNGKLSVSLCLPAICLVWRLTSCACTTGEDICSWSEDCTLSISNVITEVTVGVVLSLFIDDSDEVVSLHSILSEEEESASFSAYSCITSTYPGVVDMTSALFAALWFTSSVSSLSSSSVISLLLGYPPKLTILTAASSWSSSDNRVAEKEDMSLSSSYAPCTLCSRIWIRIL